MCCVIFNESEKPMKCVRFFDFLISFFGLSILLPLLAFVALLGFFSTGKPLFFQQRVGKSKKIFLLVKFRTMTVGTQSMGSHLVDSSSITRFGRFIRRIKIDELPQLWNVLKGDMSLVGPRPCLPVQEELINERDIRGVFEVRPGITGLSQIKGIDMSTPELLSITDKKMIDASSLKQYFMYILLTALGRGVGDAAKKI